MHALYVTAYPSDYFRKLTESYPTIAMPASQRFNHLFIKGLAENGVSVQVLCPVDLLGEQENLIRKKNDAVEEDGLEYLFCPTHSNRYIRKIERQASIRKLISSLQKEYPDLVIFLDALAPEADLIARIGRKVCMIVTDIPEFVIHDQKVIEHQYRMLRKAEYFVPLTQDMLNHIQPDGAYHSCIMEGMVDDQPAQERPEKKKVILFSGSVHRDNGVDRLVEAFHSIDTDYELHIYGAGDNYVEELKRSVEEDHRIIYHGMVQTEEVLERQKEASLLVNPRKLDLPYVRYSFPSKLLEYMASGTATISTDLSCFTEEYRKHLLLFENDTVDGIRQGLLKCISMGSDQLADAGRSQQSFVLAEKNCRVQTYKVLKMLEEGA